MPTPQPPSFISSPAGNKHRKLDIDGNEPSGSVTEVLLSVVNLLNASMEVVRICWIGICVDGLGLKGIGNEDLLVFVVYEMSTLDEVI